jgi:hypothetical protein
MAIRKMKITSRQYAKLMEGVTLDREPRRRRKTQKKDDSIAFCEALFALEDPR